MLPKLSFGVVDVRDVAHAHIAAMKNLQSVSDPEIWRQMEDQYFPNGILDPPRDVWEL